MDRNKLQRLPEDQQRAGQYSTRNKASRMRTYPKIETVRECIVPRVNNDYTITYYAAWTVVLG